MSGRKIMQIKQIPFGTTDWASLKAERKMGETGWADWKVCQFGDIRVRMLEYSAGYRADHWCTKGHILFCLEGELVTELADGAEPHRSYTAGGAKLFVVD